MNWHEKALMPSALHGEVFLFHASEYFTLWSLLEIDHACPQFFRNVANEFTSVISHECAYARLGALISSKKCTSLKSPGVCSCMIWMSADCCPWIHFSNLWWKRQYMDRYTTFKQKRVTLWSHLESDHSCSEYFRNAADDLTSVTFDGAANARWGIRVSSKMVLAAEVSWSLIVHVLMFLGTLPMNWLQQSLTVALLQGEVY